MGFLGSVLPLGFDVSLASTKARAAFLAAQEFTFSFARGFGGSAAVLNFIEQQFAGDETVHTLLPRVLTFHLNARGPVHEHDAGGNFVHVLPAVTAGADEGFFNVGFAHAECGHALCKLIFFLQADRKRAHGFSVMNNLAGGNREVERGCARSISRSGLKMLRLFCDPAAILSESATGDKHARLC